MNIAVFKRESYFYSILESPRSDVKFVLRDSETEFFSKTND
jgi:hypothetical protein